MQGHTVSLPCHLIDARSGKPFSSLRLEHQTLRLREQLLIGILLKTIVRSGAVLDGTLPSKPVTSAWWGQSGAILRTALAST
jgi:hypothetical protein